MPSNQPKTVSNTHTAEQRLLLQKGFLTVFLIFFLIFPL